MPESMVQSAFTARRLFARWTAPDLVEELDEFLAMNGGIAAYSAPSWRAEAGDGVAAIIFVASAASFGALTGLLGRRAIAATTVAIETVVLRHMHAQVATLSACDPAAAVTLRHVIADEQAHHDLSGRHLAPPGYWPRLITPIVEASTEAVIWLGMRL